MCGVWCVREGGEQLACVSGLSTHVMMTGMTAAAAACTLPLESLRHSTSLGIASCKARRRGRGVCLEPAVTCCGGGRRRRAV